MRYLLIFTILAFLSCATAKKETTLQTIPKPQQTLISKPHYEGYSLLQDPYSRKSLFSDTKAMEVGDILTVRIVERASATGEANTSASRKNVFSGALEKFFGLDLHGHNEIAGKSEMTFEGKGKTERSDKFTATITVRVVEVLPNGNLRIEGRRDLIINNEHRYIILRGIVRPEDISPDNEVLSTKIADAEVIYKGKGVIARRQGPGWGIWLLSILLPF